MGDGVSRVELRGFEPLTFSLGKPAERESGSTVCVRPMLSMPASTGPGCARGARVGGHGRATEPNQHPCSPVSGVKMAGGHRVATGSALEAGCRRASPRGSGRRLGGPRFGRHLSVVRREDVSVSSSLAVVLPFVVLVGAVAFWGYCLFDFVQADERAVRTFSKQVWVILLVLGSVVGGVLWLIYGRPQLSQRR